MLLGESNGSLLTILIYSLVLCAFQVLGHNIPSVCKMNKTGERWMLIVFFGLCLGVGYNMVIPGSLHIVTEAYENTKNHTEHNYVPMFLDGIRRLHGGDGGVDRSYLKTVGFCICTGFMILYMADFIAKEMTKNQRSKDAALPLIDKSTAVDGKPDYTNKSLMFLYICFYSLSSLGCMSGYLVCDCETQRSYILIAQLICVFPTTIIFGRQIQIQKGSSNSFASYLILSLVTPVLNILFILLLNLFSGDYLNYIYSLGYAMFFGLILYMYLMYFTGFVHVEETVTSSIVAFVFMMLPYFVVLIRNMNKA